MTSDSRSVATRRGSRPAVGVRRGKVTCSRGETQGEVTLLSNDTSHYKDYQNPTNRRRSNVRTSGEGIPSNDRNQREGPCYGVAFSGLSSTG